MSEPFVSGESQGTAFFRRPLDNARILISRLSSTQADGSDLFKGICEIASDALKVERVGVWLFMNHRSAIRCVCLFERRKRLFSEGATLNVSDFPNYFAGLRVRKTVSAENAVSDPRTNELEEAYLKPLGISSLLDAPILIDGEMVGVVCNEHVGRPREWSTEERDFAGSVADMTALKIKAAEASKLRRIIHDLDSDRAANRQRECLGSMAAGAAHDFRNFLLVISGYANEIRELAGADSEIGKFSQEITRAAERGASLADELTDVARERAGRPRVLSLKDHIAALLPSLEKVVGDKHRVEFRCEVPNGRVFIEPSQIERIIMNLVLNARDAMKEGGVITVSLEGGPTNGDGQVTLKVSDTGEGISPGIMERIFDPFFTTKPRGVGTGLGLYVVRSAIEHAGGSLHVESKVGQGTTFDIKLPRVSAV